MSGILFLSPVFVLWACSLGLLSGFAPKPEIRLSTESAKKLTRAALSRLRARHQLRLLRYQRYRARPKN